MKRTILILAFVIGLMGCNQKGAIRRESIERLLWSGGSPEARYVRDMLVDALQSSDTSDLGQPHLVNIAFHGRTPEAKEALIVFDWIASPPNADGAILTMQDGSRLQVLFHQAYLDQNQKESQNHAICQASVGRIFQPDVWDRINVDAIVSGQLTKQGQAVSNVCPFRRHTMKKENGQQDKSSVRRQPRRSFNADVGFNI